MNFITLHCKALCQYQMHQAYVTPSDLLFPRFETLLFVWGSSDWPGSWRGGGEKVKGPSALLSVQLYLIDSNIDQNLFGPRIHSY